MAVDLDTVVRTLLRNRSGLLGYIFVIIRDEHAAEDIFQEVCLLATRKHAQIDREESVLPWLRAAARTTALQKRRNQLRAPLLLDQSVLDALEPHWADADCGDATGRIDALRGCLEKLGAYPRQLIELRYGEGLSGASLAERVGRKVQTVYVALSRTHGVLSECVRRRMEASSNV